MTLTLENLVILLIIAAIVGFIGERLVGYSHGGCLTSVALGFIGALIGSWAVKQFHLPELFHIQVGTTNFPIIWAIIGAALVVGIIGLLRKRRVF